MAADVAVAAVVLLVRRDISRWLHAAGSDGGTGGGGARDGSRDGALACREKSKNG